MGHIVLRTDFESIEEDWTGLADPRRRKQLQSRINQRARRTKKLRAQLAIVLPDRRKSSRPLNSPKRAQIAAVWAGSPTFPLLPDTSLSALEWDVLFFAKDKLWPKHCNPMHWGHLNPPSLSKAIGELWSKRMVEVPVLRHSIILVTCLDLEYLTGRDYTTVRLRHANAAIRQIMLGINTPPSSTNSDGRARSSKISISSDDILFAVMALAKQSHSTSLTPLPGTFGLFNPPFPLGLQFLNLWGQNESDHMHCQAMKQIIQSRNGLADAGVSTPGFAEALYQFDLLESAKTLVQPFSDLPPFRADFLKEQVEPWRQRHQGTMGEDLRRRWIQSLPVMGFEHSLADIFCDIRIYCTWIQVVQKHTEPESIVDDPCPSLVRDLGMLRDAIEHRLLAYKSIDISVEEQLCWTVALIFTHCVIYPLPNRAPLEILLDRLVASLRVLVELESDSIDPGFLVWVMVVGAMACHSSNGAKREFFLESLRSYASVLRIDSWLQLKSVLQDHLWIDRACDDGGIAVWNMASHSQIGEGA